MARLPRGNDSARGLQVCVLNELPAEGVTVVRETFDHYAGPLARGAPALMRRRPRIGGVDP